MLYADLFRKEAHRETNIAPRCSCTRSVKNAYYLSCFSRRFLCSFYLFAVLVFFLSDHLSSSPSLSICLCLSISVSFSLSLSLSHTHTHSYTHTLIHCPRHSLYPLSVAIPLKCVDEMQVTRLSSRHLLFMLLNDTIKFTNNKKTHGLWLCP